MANRTAAPPPQRMYRIDEVAEIMRCGADTLYDLTRDRVVDHIKFGGKILFSQKHLDELIAHFELKSVKR